MTGRSHDVRPITPENLSPFRTNAHGIAMVVSEAVIPRVVLTEEQLKDRMFPPPQTDEVWQHERWEFYRCSIRGDRQLAISKTLPDPKSSSSLITSHLRERELTVPELVIFCAAADRQDDLDGDLTGKLLRYATDKAAHAAAVSLIAGAEIVSMAAGESSSPLDFAEASLIEFEKSRTT